MTKLAALLSCLVGPALAGTTPFPSKLDLSTVVMHVAGGTCFGTCPVYQIEIHGDGRVSYEGAGHVLLEGKFDWTITQAQVLALIEEFRKLDFLALRENYHDGSYDSSRHSAGLTIGKAVRRVVFGDAVCDAESSADDCMEARLNAMQAAIVRITGAASFLSGDTRTLPMLERAKFDFRTPQGANALLFALGNRNTALAREFLAHGAPPDGGSMDTIFEGRQSGSAILLVPATADVELAKTMIDMGGLADAGTRKRFLAASLVSGIPAMAKLALEHYPDVRGKDPELPWILFAASAEKQTTGSHFAEKYAQPAYALWVANFDQAEVLRLLLAAGADPRATTRENDTALHLVREAEAARILLGAGANPNAVNSKGETPLHTSHDAGIVRLLIKAGANVNARDSEGKTPLFARTDALAARLLLDAGADLSARDDHGATALFHLGDPDTAKLLIAAGADVNARTPTGYSALQSSSSTEVALEILRAGAAVPEDPEERAKLLGWARENEADDLVRLIEERAAPR